MMMAPGTTTFPSRRPTRLWALSRPKFSWTTLVVLVVLWEVAALVLRGTVAHSDTILPPLEDVLFRALPSFGVMWTGEGGGFASYQNAFLVLAQHASYTVGRVLGGSVIGIALGLAAGILLARHRRARDLIWPTLQILRPIPHMAIIPLFMVWFGGREVGVWTYIIWAIFSMMVVYVLEAVRNVSPLLQDYARTQGASESQIYRTVILPAMIPSLVGSVKVALGVSWAISLGAEFIGTQYGLGRLLILSQTFLDTGRMIVLAIIYVGLGLTINKALSVAADRWTRWAPRTSDA
jgi:ABC-type nitrate/sulfonate/bicarbonate transport system permease component